MKLSDLLDLDELQRDIDAGYIGVRTHEEFPELRIYNYTPQAQYKKHWTHAVRQCRGLVVNANTGEVVARPFAKFFNYGEPEAGMFDLDAPILGAFDKKDGSLGVLVPLPDGRLAIATRGSFHSEQAEHATAKVDEVAHLHRQGSTALFEIVYPTNRIVLDYGDLDALIHLGSVDNETGAFTPAPALPSLAGTVREALALPDRDNAEGLVLWLDPHRAVKIKQSDYLALHRAVFSLSAKEVWRQLRDGTYDEFVLALPDEFQDAVEDIAGELRRRYDVMLCEARSLLGNLNAHGFTERKDKAQWIQANAAAPITGFVFSLMQGFSPEEGIWRVLEPKGAGMALD